MSAWRVGRKVGRTIYDGDTLIGVMDTPELAEKVVRAVNLFAEDTGGLVTENGRLHAALEQLQREHNTLVRETGNLLIEEGKRIADLIEREAYENSMVVGESPPELGSYQSGRDGGIAYGLRHAAEIARRG